MGGVTKFCTPVDNAWFNSLQYIDDPNGQCCPKEQFLIHKYYLTPYKLQYDGYMYHGNNIWLFKRLCDEKRIYLNEVVLQTGSG